MMRKPIPPRVLWTLLAAAVVLPMAIALLAGVAGLLGAMGDTWGDAVVRSVALACGLAWILDLVCLVLAQTINGLADPPDEPEQ
jgi:hypothetical protein